MTPGLHCHLSHSLNVWPWACHNLLTYFLTCTVGILQKPPTRKVVWRLNGTIYVDCLAQCLVHSRCFALPRSLVTLPLKGKLSNTCPMHRILPHLQANQLTFPPDLWVSHSWVQSSADQKYSPRPKKNPRKFQKNKTWICHTSSAALNPCEWSHM